MHRYLTREANDMVTPMFKWLGVTLTLSVASVFAQQPQAPPPLQEQKAAAATTPATQAPPDDGKIRIYVTDSQSWEMRGGWGVSNGSGGGGTAGGARPQTAEIIKTFNRTCPRYTITNNKERANYVVNLDHEGGKGLIRHRNKIAVFNRDGDAIFSDSTRELGNAVKDACAAIAKDLASQKK
jgi:hypothetical protein